MLTQLVLIDTWWNVNTLTVSVMPDSIKVLIDTWWNVNNKMLEYCYASGKSFNRYMVECE